MDIKKLFNFVITNYRRLKRQPKGKTYWITSNSNSDLLSFKRYKRAKKSSVSKSVSKRIRRGWGRGLPSMVCKLAKTSKRSTIKTTQKFFFNTILSVFNHNPEKYVLSKLQKVSNFFEKNVWLSKPYNNKTKVSNQENKNKRKSIVISIYIEQSWNIWKNIRREIPKAQEYWLPSKKGHKSFNVLLHCFIIFFNFDWFER